MEQGLFRDKVHDWSNVAGPVALAYELDLSPVSVIIGPTGGGKTQASARKILRVALNQHPSPRDGVRKCRIVCLGSNYRVLWDTAIKSFKKVYPTEGAGALGTWKGSKDGPAEAVMDITGPDGIPLHIEVEFRSFSDQSAEEFMRGREVTGWWLPEMDTLPSEETLSLAYNRRGRYPEPEDRPSNPAYKAWAGVFGDANAPVINGWFHKRFYVQRRDSNALFLQPAFDQPGAENLHNLTKLDPDYYAELAREMDEYDIDRLLRCKPGYSRSGKPVHPLFDVRDHVAKGRIDPVNGETLVIGVDGGNTLAYAGTFGQRVFGAHRVMAEIHSKARKMDLPEFAKELRRLKDTRFAQVKNAIIHIDPSAGAKTVMNRQISYAQVLQQVSGIEVRLAPTNDPGRRQDALNSKLKVRGAYHVDPECEGLIEALAGGYQVAKINRKTGDGWSTTPVGNEHKDIADAEQYRCLGVEGVGAFAGPVGGPRATTAGGVILP